MLIRLTQVLAVVGVGLIGQAQQPSVQAVLLQNARLIDGTRAPP